MDGWMTGWMDEWVVEVLLHRPLVLLGISLVQ